MLNDGTALKAKLIAALLDQTEEKLPTSSVGRLGRTAAAVFRSGRLVLSGRGKGAEEPQLELEKLLKVIQSVGRLKGVAMKMGQIMSYIDMALPPELQQALSVLQTSSQPMPLERVQQVVTAELGPRAASLLERMEPAPIAAASIGQVHRSWLPDGTPVAVKIQYPEIARAIAADFGPAAIGTKMASIFYPHAKIDNFVQEARTRFLEECDYQHEARCQKVFAELYGDHPVLLIPAVHSEYCASKVLTTTFMEGLGFEAFLATDPPQALRDRLGEALLEFYLGSLFRHQIYNCDPHPGNYLFLPDERMVMLDHGCTRQFEVPFVAQLADLTRAVHLDDRHILHRALLQLGMVRPDKPYDHEMIRGFLRSFYGPMLRDTVDIVDLSAAMELREVFKKKQQLMKFTLPGEFLFLFRIRFGLMSVLARLKARANWYRLEQGFVEV